MTSEEINRAIAEACGWTIHQLSVFEKNDDVAILPPGVALTPENTFKFAGISIPDYCSDLNAMHEAILHLRKTGGQFLWLEYDSHLFKVLWGRKPFVPEPTFYLGSSHSFEQSNATALERAEAFLRTIGKWREQEAPSVVAG